MNTSSLRFCSSNEASDRQQDDHQHTDTNWCINNFRQPRTRTYHRFAAKTWLVPHTLTS